MLKNTFLRLLSKVNSQQYPHISQQKTSFSVNNTLDFKHFIDELHNFK